MSPLRRPAIASVLTCWLLAALAADARGTEVPGSSPGFLAHESFGFELSPILLNAFHDKVDQPPPRFALWPAGSLRVHRLRYPSMYWTPVAFGLGAGPGEDFGLLVQLQTELGWVHRGRGTLELGLGMGIGTFQVEFRSRAFSCDGPCTLGGGPLLLSPVARYLLIDTPDRLSLGAYVRAIVPFGDGGFGRPIGRAVGVLGGLDVGLGYFQSPAPPAPTAPATAAGAAPPPALPGREWIGLELWFLAGNDGDPWADPQAMAPDRYAFGPGADVRLLRFRGRFSYWTPLTLGLFWGPLGAPTRMAQARTEAGLVFQRRDAALEAGLGLGYGGVAVVYARDRCGGDCTLGGSGLAVSPVLRLSFAWPPGRSIGAFLRYIKQNGDDGFLGESHGFGNLYFAGLDLGFSR